MFKKINAFRDTLTYYQATKLTFRLSLLSSLIFWLSITIYTLINITTKILEILFLTLYPSVLMFLLLFIIFANFFELRKKSNLEVLSEIKAETISSFNLTKENYTKVKYLINRAVEDIHGESLVYNILANSNYSYYAKLTENEEIELIVKDANENIIYSNIFDDFRYFEEFFSKIS